MTDEIDVALMKDIEWCLAFWRGPHDAEVLRASRELGEVRQRSFDDAERPWLRAKPIFPVRATNDYTALVVLLASLELQPPC